MKFIILILILTFIPINKSNASYYDYSWTYDQDLINGYIGNNKNKLLKNIQPIFIRGYKYKGFVNYVSKKYDVPYEIFAVAAIESGFSHIAQSHAGAVGMWQFMIPTGREAGLEINNKKDERTEWKKATVAAVKYLKHLAEDHFNGDYELAILSYNAGLGNVKKSIKRMNNNNAWYLIKNDPILKKESKEYLVKFIIYSYYFDYLNKKLIEEKKNKNKD